jgi:hypothetical protein
VFAIKIDVFADDVAKLVDSCAVLGRRVKGCGLRMGRGHVAPWGEEILVLGT